MSYLTLAQRLLLVGGFVSSFALSAKPLDNAYLGGLFQRAESDPKDIHPLPPVQKLADLVNKNSFRITDSRTGESQVLQVLATYPAAAAPALKDLGEDFPEDGRTLVAPVDLTGSGVSDLVYARKDWGGWKVLSNGNRLPRPCQAFVAGLFEQGRDSARSEQIPASTHDLEVDNDLLAVVGDFLGNGTEQLAYTRPGWSQIWVVGAHGVVGMAADLSGIESNGPGPRLHWLFPFEGAKGARHTRFAYYRMGSKQLLVFSPRGLAFKNEPASLEQNWHKLVGKTLDWPREAPGKLEQQAEGVRGDVQKALSKLGLGS
jgi:hypothetical protein